MSSEKPIVRQSSLLFALPSIVVELALVFVFYSYTKSLSLAVIYAFTILLLITTILRRMISGHHRKGVSLYKSGLYAQAIAEYKKSYAFFNKHAWVDRYRCITLLSSSRMSYTEMALVNMAFCYAQSGKGKLAKQYYEHALELFPGSEMAKSALAMMASLEEKTEE